MWNDFFSYCSQTADPARYEAVWDKKSLLQAPDFVTARYGGVMYLIGYWASICVRLKKNWTGAAIISLSTSEAVFKMLWCKSVSAVLLCTFLIFMLAEGQSQDKVDQKVIVNCNIVRAPLRSSCPVGQRLVRGKCRTAYGVSSGLSNSP